MEFVSAVGNAILSKFVDGMLDKLTSMVELHKYVFEDNISEDIRELKKQLSEIYWVLDDAVEKQWDNNLVEKCVSDLRDLAYDMEDVLDDLAIEAQQRKLGAVATTHARPSKVRKVISTFKFSADMVSKVKSIRGRFHEVFKFKKDLHLGEPNRRRERPSTRESSSVLEVSEAKIYGRDDDRERLIELLKADANENVSVIPIIGMGGIGKTTLAQLLFNDTSLDFDVKEWVSVGEDFDVRKITKAILSPGSDDGKMDLNHLQMKLKEKLHQKKCFIVLDDVWSKEYEKWTLFCGPLQGCVPGSKILVTTRDQSVSQMMGATSDYLLKELSQAECLSVFAHHALGVTDFNNHLHLKAIGERIVERCRGLPLAAKALGGLLRGKLNHSDWDKVLNSKIWELQDECKILPALRLSYFHLQFPLKQCFAYCAIFPKDFEFEKMDLILLWMAEGFVNQCRPEEMIESGCQYFDELLCRSFFQVSSSDKSRYVMHDLLHDLAQSVSGETCFHLGDNQKNTDIQHAKIRHSSFKSAGHLTRQKFKDFSEMKNLRSFIAIGKVFDMMCISNKVLHDMVPKLRSLRVLSIVGYEIEELPSSISKLKRLRYLNLSETSIARLPETVCDLLLLQTLRLGGCRKLTELPTEIGNLINLQCLDIGRCHSLTKLPCSISNLTNLQCLDVFDTSLLQEMSPRLGNLRNLEPSMLFTVGKDNGVKLTELKKFSKLQGTLSIIELQNVVNIQDVKIAGLKEKHGVEELELQWSETSGNSRDEEVEVLNSLRPHQKLSRLLIYGFGGSEFPSWIADPAFNEMVNLSLWYCRNISLLPPLGQMPSLRELYIVGMARVKEVGDEFYGHGLPCFISLETLTIVSMKEWEHWTCISNAEATVKFPKLDSLELINCPKLVGKLPSCLSCLKKLHIKKCQAVLLTSMSDFTSLTSLDISEISGLVSLDDSHIEDLVALQGLQVAKCDEMKYLWKDGTNLEKLASLKRLDIKECDQLVSLVEREEGTLPCNLQVVEISECRNLEKLANGPQRLTCLEELKIKRCCELKIIFPAATSVPCGLRKLEILLCARQLPQSNTNLLRKFQSLSWQLPESNFLMECWDWPSQLFDSLGTTLNGFSGLTQLRIFDCYGLENFPEQVLGLNLHSLIIWSCKNWRGLPSSSNLSSLRFLIIYNCNNVSSLPNEMPNLTSLRLLGRNFLESLPSNLSSLQSLNIESCDNLLSLPNEMPNLTSLVLTFCHGLESLPSNLSSLQSLNIESCHNLLSLPNEMPNLTSLVLTFCHGLESLPSNLSSLQSLRVGTCNGLKSLLSNLSSLQSLYIGNCDNLLSLPNEMPNLTSLELSRCHDLESLPSNLSSLQSIRCLTHLSIRDCENLERRMSEWGLHRLTSLTKLDVWGKFPSIDSFPDNDLLLPSSLTEISIYGFQNLKFISRAILNLTSLKYLIFWNCPNLLSFPEGGLPPTLERLEFHLCPHLRE